MPAKKRADYGDNDAPLTNNPFAALGGGHASPERTEASRPTPPPRAETRSGTAWRVTRARKGGWRLAIEKRSGGKAVTVLTGVEKGGDALLKALRKHCGAGGAVVPPEGVEIQGDHRERIAAWLDRNA